MRYITIHAQPPTPPVGGGKEKAMEKEDIRVKKAIIHILDTFTGRPVLSSSELEFGSEFAGFLKSHISKVMQEDTRKECYFNREESEVYRWLEEYRDEHFVEWSRRLADFLYCIMQSSIDIPKADLAVVRFHHKEEEYIALLKLNYKKTYIHRTIPDEEEGFRNEIIEHKSVLPTNSQKLQEAAVIRLEDKAVWLVEKKYEVNGEKVNYFSRRFLKCYTRMTTCQKMAAVERVLESAIEESTDYLKQYAETMRVRCALNEAVTEEGGFAIEELADRLFDDRGGLKAFIHDKLVKYDLIRRDVKPKEDKTLRRYQRQELKTDTGIEIKIPMEQYKDQDSVQFITNPDGTTTVLIKNINYLKAKL